jgi:hypothetical protein
MDKDAKVIDIVNEALEYIRATESWEELGEFVIDSLDTYDDGGMPRFKVSLRNTSSVHEGEARRLALAETTFTAFSWESDEEE